jgi:hypothetical protein
MTVSAPPKAIIPSIPSWTPDDKGTRAQTDEPTVKISDWKPFEKNTLRAFFTATLPSGMVLHKLTLHERSGGRWIGLPAERYTRTDGTVAYARLIEFSTRQSANRFRDQILRAIENAGLA